MKVNWRKFGTTFAFLYAITMAAVFLGGCSAAFLGAISAMLPALVGAVEAAVSFVVALEGKTVSPALSATIQKWGDNLKGLVANLQNIIAAAAGAATTGVVSQIQAAMQAISDAMSSILPEFQVTDPSTTNKFEALLSIGIALVNTILGFIPLIHAKLATPGVSREQLEAGDKEAAAHISSAHKGIQEAYLVIRNTPTASPDVNDALSTLPTSLP